MIYNSFVGELVPYEVATVTVRVSGAVEIINRSRTGVIWCRADGKDPRPGEHDNFVVYLSRRHTTNKRTVTIKLVAEQPLVFSVEGTFFT